MKGVAQSESKHAYLAVAEHFPNQEIAIRRLMKTDKSFREMCEELAELKSALARNSRPREDDSRKCQDERLERFGWVFGGILGSLLSQRSTVMEDRHG
jgi:hypothetical protein